jgi:esterase/lipase superfamily enzyme/TRAP-type C4-dicarboxylate transport system substrate-binding protein
MLNMRHSLVNSLFPLGERLRLNARPIVLFVAVAQVLTAAVAPVQAQDHIITVLIEGSLQPRATRFLEELRGNLTPKIREALRFDTIVAPTAAIPKFLEEKWDMAIVSTTFALANMQTSAAASFEMPYIFSMMSNVIALQQSPIGLAGLNAFSERGMTGLVYLNGGVTRVAGRGDPKSPNDLKGRKIAVFSSAQRLDLQKFGTNPLSIQQTQVPEALRSGEVDSVVINSGNPDSWVFPEQGFLLTDSLKAQVAIVVTHDASWDRIPFVYRARIGDAAVAASRRLDETLVEAEGSLFSKARSSGVSLVSFRPDDTSSATRKWIDEQPEKLHEIYFSVFKYLPSTTVPSAPGRGGQVGKLYFATTRDDTGDDDFRFRFGDTRTGVVKCGRIAFSAADPRGATATFDGPLTAESAACGATLNNVLQSSKRMLIFVHGFNNRFAEAAERAMALKNAMGSDTEVLLWSWPSKRDGILGNYAYDKESVGGEAQQSLVRFLRALKRGSDTSSLNLLAHSMGGWHLIGALRTLSDQDGRPTLQNVVLAAPDVPSDEFRFALDDLSRIARRYTLYACEWDVALMTSKAMNAYPRAGSGGDADIVVDEKVESIDVEAGLSLNHSYVFEAGKVLSDISALVLAGSDAAARGLFRKPKAAWHYWRFFPQSASP